MEVKVASVYLCSILLCFSIPINGQNPEIIHFDAANVSTLSRSAEQGFKNFHKRKRKYLNVTAIKVLQVKKEKVCSLRCVAELQCVSFNFAASPSSTGHYQCELLAADMFHNFLTTNINFHHFVLQTKCLSTVCKNIGICVPHYNNDTFTCKNCDKALGLEDRTIPNSAMTASSNYLGDTKRASHARLRSNTRWSSGPARVGHWLKVDLGKVMAVVKVATQGRPWNDGHYKWVSKYSISSSMDQKQWQDYTENGMVKIFDGNFDQNTVVTNSFKEKIIARYIRLVVQAWNNHPELRMELYGCEFP